MVNKNQSQVPASRDRTIHLYVQAMDQGDIDTIIRILEMAMDDHELDHAIAEINLAIEEEEMLSPLANDAQLVRELINKYLPSSKPIDLAEQEALTVRDVAAQMQAKHNVPVADQQAHQELLGKSIELPGWLSIQEIKRLAHELQIQASDRFWKSFRDTEKRRQTGRTQNDEVKNRRTNDEQDPGN
jgi:DNA-binding phage protein